MPMDRTFRTRRLIAASRVIPRKAKAHGDDGDLFLIIENALFHGEPIAQPVPGTVIVRQTAFMNADSRRLAGNADLRGTANAQDRAHAVGENIGADAALANIGDKRAESGLPIHAL